MEQPSGDGSAEAAAQLFHGGGGSWTVCTSNLSFTAGRGDACLQSQDFGGRGR